jgi:protein SCO1/2
MAQANEAPIPKASQLIFHFIQRNKNNKSPLPEEDKLANLTFASMKLSKKNWLYIGFFTALAVGFYIALSVIIPGYNEKKSPPVSVVRPFAFTNQDGNTLMDKDMAGKVYAVEFFFTTCKGICPRMNNNMKLVYEALKEEKDFYILSFTCDPKNDSAAQLKKYADSLNVNTNKWIFLTGRKDSLYNAARLSFSIDDPKNIVRDINDDFLHSQNWALVDRNGDVVAIYDGLKSKEVKNLIRRARQLLKE